MIKVNMQKAREIKKEMLRVERSELLAELDTQYLRALEQDDEEAMQEIKEKKQALRDATKHTKINNAKTPKALLKIKLESLIDG